MPSLTDTVADLLGSVLGLTFIAWALHRRKQEQAEAATNPERVRRRRRTRLAVLLLVAASLTALVIFCTPRTK